VAGARRAGNRLKRRLGERDGEVVIVVAGQAASADTIDFVGSLGFDGFWIEGEHGPMVWDRLGDQTRACDLWGMAALVRVARLDPSLVARALSLGAHGIVIPGLRQASEAAALVDAAKFAPIGHRGVSRGRRSYGAPRFLETENDETVLVVQLEDPEALDNVEQICAVEHIDVVFVAPNDLAQAMGHQGQPEHPDVAEAIDATLKRIVASGRIAGTSCTRDQIDRFVGLGVRFLYTTVDAWLVDGARHYLADVASATAAR
jgi:4-hydroxy-2-oxoheptanedioate aldolase